MNITRMRFYENEFKIRLVNEEKDSLMKKALEKSEKYSMITKNNSPYGFNHPHSHLVGLVAEHATWVFFTELEGCTGRDYKIDPVYQDDLRDGECDIIVLGKRIEVKGIKYGSWKKYGPCISTTQLSKIKRKADIVLWVLYNEKQNEVTFKGFNNVSDIEGLVPEYTGEGEQQVLNYKVLDILNPLTELGE